MSELKIMVELDPEDRARLDAILAELKNARPNCEACVSSIGIVMQNCLKSSIHQPAPVHPADAVPPATAADVVTPAPEAPAEKPAVSEAPAPEAPAPTPAPVEKLPTLDDVRRAVMNATRMSEAVKKKVKALVNEYAEGVTSMKPDVYPEFLARLAELVKEAGV